MKQQRNSIHTFVRFIITFALTQNCLYGYSQSAKEINYTQQGLDAEASGNFKLACENFEIAANFAKGENSPNYKKLSLLKQSACDKDEKNTEKKRRESSANFSKDFENRFSSPTASMSEILANSRRFNGKRVLLHCPILYAGSSGKSAYCEDSKGLYIAIDVDTLNPNHFKFALDHCGSSSKCTVCVSGILEASPKQNLLKNSLLHEAANFSSACSRSILN